MMPNIPTALTWLRILLIPVVVGVLYLPDAWMGHYERNLTATAVFIVAALTDWLDGWLARMWNQTSSFGAFLDPVADKLMVAAALVFLVEFNRVEAWVAFVIIGREITISALREWMAKIGKARHVAVNMLGKIKTVAQMIAIPMLLYQTDLFGGLVRTQFWGTVLIYVAAVLTIVSMFYYLKLAMPELRGDGRGR